MLTDEIRYKLMRALEANPKISQRQLARELGVSLGRVNYCLQALVRKRLVKSKGLSSSENSTGGGYLLTPRGLEQKAKLAIRHLKAKTEKYEELRAEIAQLQREIR